MAAMWANVEAMRANVASMRAAREHLDIPTRRPILLRSCRSCRCNLATTHHSAYPMAATNHGTSSTREEPPRVEMTLKGHEGWVNGVAFISGTRLLVTCSNDKSLRVWDLDTGKQVGEPLLGHDERVLSVAASSDGHWIVSGGDNGSILFWEVETQKRVPVSFKGHDNSVFDVVFAPDNETFASASRDETVCVWKRKTGKIVLGPLRVGSEANSVAYSPDGRKLATGTEEQTIVWNSATGEELLKIEQLAWRVAFTPDGQRLVSGHLNDIRMSDMSDAATGDIIKQFDARTQYIFSLAIAPNSSKFATTSNDQTTRFFDLTTFEPIGEPLEHPQAALVRCVAFSEDSQLIATGCDDNLVRTWTVPQSESEQESQQKILEKTIPGPKPRRQHAGIPPRFFGDFDTRSPPGCNNRTATTSRHAEGSRIKNVMSRLFSRSPLPSNIPAVDVFATRGKYRNATAIDAKRHVVQRPRPFPQQAHTSNTGVANAGPSSSNTPPADTSNVTDGTTPGPATLQTGSTSASAATNRPPSPMDVEYVPDISCFALLARCFPFLSCTHQTSTSASHTR